MRRTFVGAWVLAAMLVAAPALATPEEDAAAAYDVGAAAYDQHEYAKAAEQLARADALAANDVALELALHAVVRTDDAVLAMTLADRATARASTSGLVAAAAAARKTFEDAVGKLVVRCPAGVACTATLDDAPVTPGAASHQRAGRHKLAIRTEARTEDLDVVVEARKTVEIVATASSPRDPVIVRVPERAPEPSGLAPAWFFVGVGATALVSGAAIASGVDTVNKHDAFAADRSNTQIADEGKAADTRTTALLVTAGGLAVVTGVVGLFFVRWGGGSRVTARADGVTVRF